MTPLLLDLSFYVDTSDLPRRARLRDYVPWLIHGGVSSEEVVSRFMVFSHVFKVYME